MATEDKVSSFLRLIRRSQRGRLKVYLGYCPGVGKTYQMLLEGHRLHQEGIDVVIGLVETHGRADIAKLMENLEIIPRQRHEYRGITIEEMDVEAILARKPQVALIDELAHTNVPGSRNPKRYQDIQDIVAAGIHVITTMNVQHLESLYDTVERVVGVKVRERIPDSVLAEADQIVNVDLTSEDLQKRLEEGKIYPRDRIQTALGNFFKSRNIEQLRELTLREVAAQIDFRRRELPEEERIATPDQIMVCLSSRGPNSERLLRYASRLAGKLNRNWYAVYVQTHEEEATIIDAQTQRMLSDTLTLAKQLGAIVFTYKGEDVADTLLRFAKEYRVGHIIIGRPGPFPWWKKLWRSKSIVERLVEDSEGISIIVLDAREPSLPVVPIESVVENPPAEKLAPPTPAPREQITLTRLLSPAQIAMWTSPVSQADVLRILVRAAMKDDKTGKCSEALQGILDRERQGSTFLNEGVAFPHVRLQGLSDPLVSLGMTKQGVSDVATEKPVELVFLILSPAENPDVQVQVLALASRAAQDRHLLQSLKAAPASDEAWIRIRDWELSETGRASVTDVR